MFKRKVWLRFSHHKSVSSSDYFHWPSLAKCSLGNMIHSFLGQQAHSHNLFLELIFGNTSSFGDRCIDHLSYVVFAYSGIGSQLQKTNIGRFPKTCPWSTGFGPHYKYEVRTGKPALANHSLMIYDNWLISASTLNRTHHDFTFSALLVDRDHN